MPVYSGINDVSLPAKAVAQGGPQCMLIFDQQDALIHLVLPCRFRNSPWQVRIPVPPRRGKCSVKMLPTPTSLTTESLPPIASARRLARDSPNPVPWIWAEPPSGGKRARRYAVTLKC